MNLHNEMKAMARYMDAHPETSLDDIRALAEKNHPDDPFLKHGDTLGVGTPVGRFMKEMNRSAAPAGR